MNHNLPERYLQSNKLFLIHIIGLKHQTGWLNAYRA